MTFQPHWEEKCWGRVQHIFASIHTAVSHLEIKEGFQCSIHRHKERSNLFAVIEGKVMIESMGTLGDCVERRMILEPGDVAIVPDWIWHRFIVLESGRMVEVYEATGNGSCRLDDIERLDEGGPVGTSV